MDLSTYRSSQVERERSDSLLGIIPRDRVGSSLDIGAREGWFSVKLAEIFDRVTAVDLEVPRVEHPKVQCVVGDATALGFADGAFDLVFCAEVLEHVPTTDLAQACAELERVAKHYLVIGVPFEQDIRFGRSHCYTCGGKNPQWGHVNRFSEASLRALFPGSDVRATSFVGENDVRTNAVSVALMDLAGNPHGTYYQDEPCVHCGAKLIEPPPRTFLQKVMTRMAWSLQSVQSVFHRSRPNWIHLLLEKKAGAPALFDAPADPVRAQSS